MALVNAGALDAIEQARRLHHEATADPEVDGVLTADEHEEKHNPAAADDSEIRTTEAPRASKK